MFSLFTTQGASRKCSNLWFYWATTVDIYGTLHFVTNKNILQLREKLKQHNLI